MARKSLVATVVGIAAFAVPNAFADKGGIPHDGSNGQGRPAATQQQTSATAPHGKALAKGHAKSHSNAKANSHAKTHATGRALAKGHTKTQTHGNSAAPKTQGPPASNTHAKAGKTTICHATGSATNPYVTITISNNAIPAHQRHQDGRDIIPAPEGGCPTGQESQQPSTPPQEQGSTPQQETPGSTNTESKAPAATQNASQPAAGQVLGESTTGTSPSGTGNSTPAGGSVLGATTSGSSPSASTSPAATATRASSSSSLPFTGTDAIIVAILGLAARLIGVTMRRAAAVRSERS
jgi:hypothetical protein